MAVPHVLAISLNPRLSSPHLRSRVFKQFFVYQGYGFDPCKLNSMSCLTVFAPHWHTSLCFSKQCKLCYSYISGMPTNSPVLSRSLSSHFATKIWESISCHQSSRRHAWKRCHAKEEDSEGAFSSEGIILDEKALERDLEMAIEEENYAQAAKIRDSLRFLQENSKTSVLAANARFYNLFRIGDLAGLQALWAKGDNVCCVHPGVSGISGYDLVMGSWEFVCAEYEFPLEIEVKNVEVHVRGDFGYVTCIEVIKTKGSNWGKQFATNVFERVDGHWYICIHHASYIDL